MKSARSPSTNAWSPGESRCVRSAMASSCCGAGPAVAARRPDGERRGGGTDGGSAADRDLGPHLRQGVLAVLVVVGDVRQQAGVRGEQLLHVPDRLVPGGLLLRVGLGVG